MIYQKSISYFSNLCGFLTCSYFLLNFMLSENILSFYFFGIWWDLSYIYLNFENISWVLKKNLYVYFAVWGYSDLNISIRSSMLIVFYKYLMSLLTFFLLFLPVTERDVFSICHSDCSFICFLYSYQFLSCIF